MGIFFTEFLFLHSFCSSIIVQLSVRTDRGVVVKQKWTGMDRGREGVDNGKNVRTFFMDNPEVHFLQALISLPNYK